MKATEFEFRYRSLLNLIQFWIAFQLYSVDHVNAVCMFVRWHDSRGALVARVVFGFATVLLGVAAAMRTWAAAYLRSDVVHDAALHAEKIVADGPFRHVRNPLYLGTFLLTLGIGLLASRSGFAFLVGLAAIRILRLIGREEAQLEKQQGAAFREYCNRVPRLIPSLRTRVPPAGLKPEWGQAFRGEAFMWGFFIMMTAFTITLRDRVADVLGGTTLALWLVQRVSQHLRKTAVA
jgi:protein-S-isoprenylcysteine O-methyltransferase Ste14